MVFVRPTLKSLFTLENIFVDPGQGQARNPIGPRKNFFRKGQQSASSSRHPAKHKKSGGCREWCPQYIAKFTNSGYQKTGHAHCIKRQGQQQVAYFTIPVTIFKIRRFGFHTFIYLRLYGFTESLRKSCLLGNLKFEAVRKLSKALKIETL